MATKTRKKGVKRFNYIVITGRRWFDQTWGNTYHSVTVMVDGEYLDRVDYAYGYGDQYVQSAHELLQKHGYFPKTDNNMDDYNVFRNYQRENRKKFVITVSDVKRKRDL